MERSEALHAIDSGIALWWRTIGNAEGFIHRTGDIEYVMAEDRNGPERIFNVRLFPDTAEGRVDEITMQMKARALPGGMILTSLSTPGNIAELLARRGLTIDDSSPCMALALDNFHAARKEEPIEVMEIREPAFLPAWAGIVNTALFGCELFSLPQYEGMLRQENTRLYAAFWGGEPACACMTIRDGAFATLECVATLPEYRRRGLASAAVSQALVDMKDNGVRIVTLRSEHGAESLYRELGFTEYCRRVVASTA